MNTCVLNYLQSFPKTKAVARPHVHEWRKMAACRVQAVWAWASHRAIQVGTHPWTIGVFWVTLALLCIVAHVNWAQGCMIQADVLPPDLIPAEPLPADVLKLIR